MGLIHYEREVELKVSPKRMWKALVQDSKNFFPKSSKGMITSVSFEGNHDHHGIKPGDARILHYAHGIHKFSHAKEIFEEVDDENLKVKVRVVEGAWIGIDCSHFQYYYGFKETPQGCTFYFSMDYEGLTGENPEIHTAMLGYLKAFEAYLLTHDDYKT